MTKSEYETDRVDQRQAPSPERPDTLREISQIIYEWRQRHRGADAGLPADTREAARAWITMQGEPAKTERAYLKRRTNGTDVWITPYLNRLCQMLRRYLSMQDIDREIILKAYRAGIPWRGDPIPHFLSVIKHSGKTDLLHDIEMGEE